MSTKVVVPPRLYGVSATDPSTFMSVGAVLLATASLAAFVAASRASRVDPLVAIRGE